jgi:hypothetical protein
VARITTASRAGGSAARSSRVASAMSVLFDDPVIAEAPLETSDRCEASPNTKLLSNTHCIARPGRPRNGRSTT